MSTDCCYAVDTPLMTVDEALALVDRRVRPVTAEETVAVTEARARVLAADLTARATHPSFPAAAMDGFAARHADLGGAAPRLRVVGRISAGHPLDRVLAPGEAVEIFTGAPLPPGADTVAMVEHCTAADGHVVFPGGCAAGQHVRPAGEDFRAGDVVLTGGRRLRPQDVAMAAAAGHGEVPVRARLRIAVFSTGDEVVEPGQPLAPGQIHGSNRHGQMAYLEAWGHAPHDLGHLPDDAVRIAAALHEAGESFDAIVTSGGVSVGGEDHVRDAVAAAGGRLFLWRLKVKPGKPLALGEIGRATFIGLPGYPVSAMIQLMLMGRAVLDRLAGATAMPLLPTPLQVPAGFAAPAASGGRRQFLRGCLELAPGGGQVVVPHPAQGSGVLSSLIGSDGLIDIADSHDAIRAGDRVDFYPFDWFLR
jgi:molybdopterin molybdotransferase